MHKVIAGVTLSLAHADVEAALEPARMGGKWDIGVESMSFANETVQVYRLLFKLKLQAERNTHWVRIEQMYCETRSDLRVE